MPRPGSDPLTEDVRSAVEPRGHKTELQAAVERIAADEGIPKAQVYRKAVKEYVARWDAQHTGTPEPISPTSTRSRVFP